MQTEATYLIIKLSAELAALESEMPTHEQRRDAIDGRGGIRSRYVSRLHALRVSDKLSEAMCIKIQRDNARRCDWFIAEPLPPADSGR